MHACMHACMYVHLNIMKIWRHWFSCAGYINDDIHLPFHHHPGVGTFHRRDHLKHDRMGEGVDFQKYFWKQKEKNMSTSNVWRFNCMFWLDSHPKSAETVCCWNIWIFRYSQLPKARNLRVFYLITFASSHESNSHMVSKTTKKLQISSLNIWFSAAEHPQPTNQQQPKAHSPAILRKCVEKTWKKTRPRAQSTHHASFLPSHCEPSSLDMPFFTRSPKKDFRTSSCLIAILSHLNPNSC